MWGWSRWALGGSGLAGVLRGGGHRRLPGGARHPPRGPARSVMAAKREGEMLGLAVAAGPG